MPTIGLISEGLTDQIILERIIEEVCEEIFADDIYINPIQPLRDATDSGTTSFGGWELVLECCEQRAADALSANDYVIIHLDTDQGEHPNFGVRLTDHGVDRSQKVLVADAIAAIHRRLGADIYPNYAGRLLFAICVHSMESWLLIYIYDRDEPKNSGHRLNLRRRKSGLGPLVKAIGPYEQIASTIRRKRLLKLSVEKHSLGLFLHRLLALSK